MIKDYYKLMKPGIVYGNAITAAAGFILGSKGFFNWPLFIAALIGLSSIVASGCVLNNYFDRLSDEKMVRTRSRPLVQKKISLQNAIIFGIALFFIGFLTLTLFTTMLAMWMAILGFILYVFFYTVWKYRTVFATELGSIAGAIPPVVGYSAATGRLDWVALSLFLVVAFWQMPHFFAIAIYRREEYASASIPVSSIQRGTDATQVWMIFYLAAFALATVSLAIFSHMGSCYLVSALLLNAYWLWQYLKGLKSENEKRWARRVFLSSLVVILGVCAAIAFDTVLSREDKNHRAHRDHREKRKSEASLVSVSSVCSVVKK